MRQTSSRTNRPRGFTLVELLVVIAIIGTLVALLLPAVQAARERARTVQCLNNIRQLAAAVIMQEGSSGSFPGYVNRLGITGDVAANQTRASWVVMIFPHIEQTALHSRWATGTEQFVSLEMLVCASDPAESLNEPLLSYVANTGYIRNDGSSASLRARAANGVFFDNTRTANGAGGPSDDNDMNNYPEIRMVDASIKDGKTNTLMLAENLSATHWGYFNAAMVSDQKYHFGFCWEDPQTVVNAIQNPTSGEEDDPRFRRVSGLTDSLLNQSITAETTGGMTKNYGFPSSNHPGGVNVAFMGGRATFINDQVSAVVYAQLMTSNQRKSQLVDLDGTTDRNLNSPTNDDF